MTTPEQVQSLYVVVREIRGTDCKVQIHPGILKGNMMTRTKVVQELEARLSAHLESFWDENMDLEEAWSEHGNLVLMRRIISRVRAC